MEDSFETRIRLLEERTNGFKQQEARSISHLESERDVRRAQGQRIDRIEKELEHHEKILRNGGQGLMFKVDRLEQNQESAKNRIALYISLAALAIGLIDLLINYLKK